jgi:hypothetical protein
MKCKQNNNDKRKKKGGKEGRKEGEDENGTQDYAFLPGYL